MEDRVEVQVEEELETIVEVSNPFENLVWAKLSESELRHFLVDLDILSRKLDHVSDVENMSQSFVPFELFLHPFFE
jgi:hypothetical protein